MNNLDHLTTGLPKANVAGQRLKDTLKPKTSLIRKLEEHLSQLLSDKQGPPCSVSFPVEAFC